MSRPFDSARPRNAAIFLIGAVPIAGAFMMAISWLRFGIDFPLLDDFRAYDLGTALSLRFGDLFTSANDTLYPVGKVLDVLAQRYLGGNPVPYQLLSMLGLLGGLLFLQWRLLTTAVEDRLVAAVCFLLTVFMVQPGSYWGIQNLAYHQGLPTIFILAALALTVHDGWPLRWRIPAIFVLGLLAGFSYISGAFGALAVAVVLIALGGSTKPRNAPLLWCGLALLAPACIAVGGQTWVILSLQGGHIHQPAASWAFPSDAAFWIYLLGKVARALALPASALNISLGVAGLFLGLAVWLGAVLCGRWLAHARRTPAETKLTVIFVSLLALILSYLMLLAAGRANLRPPNVTDVRAIFFYAYYSHYHFFWVTLLVPWMAAAAFVFARPVWQGKVAGRTTVSLGIAVAGLAITSGGVFDHTAFFRGIERQRVDIDLPCVRAGLEASGPIACPSLYPFDLRPAFTNARRIGASFTRHLGADLPHVVSTKPGRIPHTAQSSGDPITSAVSPPS